MCYQLAVIGVVLLVRPGMTEPVDYVKDIKPLLASRCTSCHGVLAQKGKLRLDTAAFLRTGGRNGPAVVPGKSEQSLLVEAILGETRKRMPPENEGTPLSPGQIAMLRTWIDQGAKGPAHEDAPEDPRRHWAFVRPIRSMPPSPRDPAWNSNPIDVFVAGEHARLGLRPSPVADPATLLRRVTLDLTGLPPTREELRDFLADASPQAYEKVVERLLASPRYGERWGRHWMDVWRYSDWYGRRQQNDWRNSSPTQWRWRDWIVTSLNADRGYDRMVEEMLAADEIVPEDDAAQAATGFLVRNYYSLNPDTWMKDQVEHTAKAFLGLTLNCCHCHDHKFDPISQEEYFRFRAFFEPLGLRQDRVAGEADPGPFKKYDYASSGKVITSGLVRVLDERFTATTRMYRLGNERDYFPDRPPVLPGAPAIVGGDRLTITPVQLPSAASYPGLKAFIQNEETEKRQAAVATARAGVGKAPEDVVARARLAAAEADLRSVSARIVADNVRFGKATGDPDRVALVAAQAEGEARLAAAELAVLEADAALAIARTRNDAKALALAESKLATAKKGVESVRAALAKGGVPYSPLSPTYPTTSTGRRTALARWITSDANPLTARVAVNHLWMRHFGRPLVESVFDFGRNGKRPSHPELLDWLAVELMESNWSMKRLHRRMVTSRTYRAQSAADPDPETLARDPDNRTLWRFPARRLEAEVVRDSLLFVSGDLDPTVGGKVIETTDEAKSRRRSLYFACHPEGGGALRLLEFFDAPDPCDCYRRSQSLVPQQALALTNSDFILERSLSLTRRVVAGVEHEDADRLITAVFEQILSRGPTVAEQAACREFLTTQTDLVGRTATPEVARLRARASLVRVLFNHHEFVTLR